MANVEEVLKESDMRFHPEARTHYTYPSAEELLTNPDKIYEFIQDFKMYQLPRLRTLEFYRDGQNTEILSQARRKEDDVADTRAVHDFGGYITTFMEGFMTGNEIGITYADDEEDSEIDQLIKTVNELNNSLSTNSSLANDASCYGRAYEIIYRRVNDTNVFKKLDPKNTFVIYDTSIERNPIAGVRFYFNRFEGEEGVEYVEFHDINKKIVFKVVDGELAYVSEEPHGHKEVPIHELENNEQRMGDFEKVLTLIDLYDAGQSDIANYMQDFNNAILAVYGDIDLGTDDADKQVEILTKMRKALLMHLVPPQNADGKEGSLKAEYLTKSYDVAGSESYKDRVQSDIHKFSFTPDTSDENFKGVSSGEALKYKLFGLEVLEGTKENLFKQFLKRRYKLIMNVNETASEVSGYDESLLRIKFTPKLPRSLESMIKNFTELGGDITNETKMRITGVVEDPKDEAEKLKKENAAPPQYDFEAGE